jgi:hypothetical protein
MSLLSQENKIRYKNLSSLQENNFGYKILRQENAPSDNTGGAGCVWRLTFFVTAIACVF